MLNTLNDCIRTAKRDKKNKTRGLAVLLVLSFIVSLYVFIGLRQPGLTLAGTATCGQEEHTHGEECFELQLICGLQDTVHTHTDSCYTETAIETHSEPILNCNLTEVPHEHTEACYEKHLVCDKEEHIHSVDCYSDSTADVETQLDWQSMFDGYLIGDIRADIVSIAKSQIGYAESSRNFIVDDNGVPSGYTRYGAWYGAPYNGWSAMFVSFCLHYAGADESETPYNIGASSMAELWNKNGRYILADEYVPEYGDLIFFENNAVGIVSSVNFDVLTVVQGDVGNAVVEQTIMAYDESILGYGTLVMPEENTGSDELILEACSCGSETLPAASHADTCAYRSQLTTLASEKTAEELYAIWTVLPGDAQEYILQHLTDNAQQYGTKAEDLKALIDGGSAGAGQEIVGGETIPDTDTNWIALRDSGFFTYWEQEQSLPNKASSRMTLGSANTAGSNNPGDMQIFGFGGVTTSGDNPSDVQIHDDGGETTSDDGKVVVSKTIDGTDLENVFDITLAVQTQESISEMYEEPDMAVVIVMDISNTMKENFGNTTRYEAAMLAAEKFVDNFAALAGDASKIGYVAFNTNAHQIFGLTTCSDANKASLKNTMRQQTGNIINAEGYGASHSRFTNIEAGLARGNAMLASATNENKYIIFLSDGFPTTYISSGYNGYDPYTSSGTKGTDGVFYDDVKDLYCKYGTSYSNKAAIRARTKATQIKTAGVKIFSIGVDVGGQTIAGYELNPYTDFSIIDRTNTTYEIGSATSTAAYKNWLQNSIGSGSGYYYDSTNTAGLQAAYDQIFAKILQLEKESFFAEYVQDPLPQGTATEYMEFIGFYDVAGNLVFTDLDGPLDGENTALFDDESSEITWDLKESGYAETTVGGVTTYSYELVYRVRLKNELTGFSEGNVYDTNDPTALTYRVVDSQGVISEQRTVDFEIPAVHGYLADLYFTKRDSYGSILAGAEFALTHDTESCPICRGDGIHNVTLDVYEAVSDSSGIVSFTGIPSGHTYTLQETLAPPGYVSDNKSYSVVVAYDVLTMEEDWTGEVINKTGPEFPPTGGSGILPYILSGILLVTIPVVCGYIRRRKHERRYGT